MPANTNPLFGTQFKTYVNRTIIDDNTMSGDTIWVDGIVHSENSSDWTLDQAIANINKNKVEYMDGEKFLVFCEGSPAIQAQEETYEKALRKAKALAAANKYGKEYFVYAPKAAVRPVPVEVEVEEIK